MKYPFASPRGHLARAGTGRTRTVVTPAMNQGGSYLPSPFDDEDGVFHVLRNRVGEFSFWPAHAAVPAGWDVVLASARPTEAETYVREHWTTLTPAHRLRTPRAET